MEPSTRAGQPDAGQDLRIAEILEAWQARRNQGETADLLTLAGGDAALAEQVRQLSDVVGAIDASGFAAIGAEPVEAELVETGAPCVPDFAIVKELGRGGMGVVYEARQISLDRVVALKLLPLGTVDRAAAQRFAREAATAASLQHPNIVPIYATGEAPGTLWYAMPRIDGESLAQLIAKSPTGLAWQRVVEIGMIAAEALMYAHQQGVVHRDVKPANFLQDAAGQIWLTDFGVARREVDATVTLSHAICGTPRYMSPEQIAGCGEPVDHRTDLYSLGATLYELATGRTVVQGAAPLDVLEEIRRGEPTAPRTINPRLPRALEVVLLKCLEKSPRDRYATAADLLSDLKALRDGRPIAARGLPVWTVWRRRLTRHAGRVRLAALAATMTIAVVGAAALSYQYYTLSRQAQLQISSAGGPYEAAIRPAPVDGDASDEVQSVALPMRQPLTLKAGDYEIAFAARGRFGERARLQLDPGDVAMPRYIDQRPPPPEVDIDRMWVSEIHSADQTDKLFLGTLSDRQLAVYTEEGRECFRCGLGVTTARDEAGGTPAPQNKAGGTPAPQGGPTGDGAAPPLDELTTTAELLKHVDFTYQMDAPFTGRRLARRPYLAQPQRLMPEAVDLNGDGEPDFVIAARLEPIVAALDHRGDLLWSSRVEASVPSDAPPPWIGANQVQAPAVLQMLPTRDQTGDGIRDVLVVSMAIRSPPAANPRAVYPQITLLSGGNGGLVWTTPLPAITAVNGRRWPSDGLLEYRPLPQHRPRRPLQINNPLEVTRSPLIENRRVQWSDRQLANLPVTPPINLLDDGQHALVVTGAREAQKLDLASGQLGVPMVLAPATSVLATSPRAIRRGPDRGPAILVDYLDDMAYGMLVGEKLALYAPEKSTPLWSKSQVVDTNMNDPGFEQADFPLVADLDHDGIDEIVVAATDNFGAKMVRCLDAGMGADRWQAPVRVRCVETSPERICLVGDIDADGVDDLAIASLYGEAKRDNLEAIRTQRVDVSVCIDVVSGRDGQRLKFARQAIGEVDQFTHVVEIDSLRLASPRGVEASLVWGEGGERLLDSLSVRFSVTRDELPLLAPGVTALTRPSPAGGGFYLRRPGPDDVTGETAVWIGHKHDDLLVAGYQWVLAGWTNTHGAPRVLLQDRARSRLAVAEVPSGRVLWRRVTTGASTIGQHLRRLDRDRILVQTYDAVSLTCSLTCLDAETGEVRAALQNRALGGTCDAATGTDGSDDLYLLTEASGRFAAANYSAGFRLQKIALGTGKTAWEKSLLSGLIPVTGRQCPVKMIIADVDGDGISDCIVPDGAAGGSAIRVVAISGRDGQDLWSCGTEMSMREWPYNIPWPLMELTPSQEGQPRLVIMDKRGPDKIVVRLLRLSDGHELDSRAYAGDARRFGLLPRHAALSLRVDRVADAEPTVSLAVPSVDAAEQLTIACSRLQIRGDRLVQTPDDSACWKRIVLSRDALTRYDGDENEVAWRRTLQPGAARPSLVATADPKYMIVRSERWDTLLNLSAGQPVCVVPRVRPGDFAPFVAEGPMLLMSGATPYLMHHERDGVRISSHVEMTADASQPDARLSKAFRRPCYDPRQWRNPVGSPLNMADRTFTNLVANWIRAGVQGLFGFVIPLACLSWLVRKRRFSLAQLSLAPLAVLACLITWHTMLTQVAPVGRAGQEPWFVVLIAGTMVVAAAGFVVRSIVERRVWLVACMVALAACLTAALQWTPALLANDDVHYRLGWDHFLAGMVVALIMLLPPALVVWRFVEFIARRLGRRGSNAR